MDRAKNKVRCQARYKLPSQCNALERRCRRKALPGKKFCHECTNAKTP